jgi:hypothetical protein
MQAYRSLEWEFSEREKSVDFLDLTIKNHVEWNTWN